jgi:hypothetical protein
MPTYQMARLDWYSYILYLMAFTTRTKIWLMDKQRVHMDYINM